MGFRIGNLKTLNYESRLDPMTDEGHLRPFYDTSRIRESAFEVTPVIRITPVGGSPTDYDLTNGSQSLGLGEYTIQLVGSATGVRTVQFTMWGAGGGGGSRTAGIGGAGGYTAGGYELLVGDILHICVGGGGDPRSNAGVTAGECGGALGGMNAGVEYGGCGGGYTGIFRNSMVQSNAILIAGGGGGAGADQIGGAGGASNGQIGQLFDQRGGGGGSQTAGGFAGFTDAVDGSSLQGGTAGMLLGYPGGGGGGGYYGGGGGGSGDTNGHGGGGGSSFVDQTRVIAGSTLGGTDEVPGNNADPNRGVAGNGGNANASGTDGKFIIT